MEMSLDLTETLLNASEASFDPASLESLEGFTYA
jgi:hypothetical protein